MKNGKLIFCLGILLSLMTGNSYAQLNLVPNPSFEDTSNWNNWFTQNGAFPWFNPTLATPDYYSTFVGYGNIIPMNANNGFQMPRTGNAFAGLYTFVGFTREYLEIELSDSLRQNSDYLISFYVSRAEKKLIATDKIGAYLSSAKINQSSGGNFPYQPQIENPLGNILYDTLSWSEISGILHANGGEKFLTIGNFADDLHTIRDTVFSSGLTSVAAYYYIDDVSVIPLDSIQSLPDYSIKTNFTISPNPTSNNLQITFSNSTDLKSINIYSAEGKLLKHLKEEQGNSKTTIDVSNFSDGIYFIEVKSSTGSVRKKFVVLR